MRLTVPLLLCALTASPALAQQTTTIPVQPTVATVLVIPAIGDPNTLAPIGQASTILGVGNNDGLTTTPGPSCNLVPAIPATGTPVNPKALAISDPFTSNRDCRLVMPIGLPNGTGYRAVATFSRPAGGCVNLPTDTTITNPDCISPRSVAAGPFDIVGVVIKTAPAAPQAGRVVQ